MTAVPALLLTGGASRRMGVDKATIEHRGETLAAHAARVLASVCDPVIEVGTGVSGAAAVREDPPGAGPLAAIVAGVDALRTIGPVVVLACDMPFVEPELVRLVAQWPGAGTVVPIRAGRAQFGFARYGRGALVAARLARLQGRTALRLACADGFEVLPESVWRAVAPPNALDDIDTPADRARSIDAWVS
jgi:molybdopterin-guanine dinucleotide biosynthesis protein A